MNCKRCGSDIVKFSLSEGARLQVWSLLNQDVTLFAVKKLIAFGYSHTDSKRIISHLSSEYLKCSKCNAELPSDKNLDCPNCKSFNHNEDLEPIFSRRFCSLLENRIYQYSEKKSYLFWCDGIDHLPSNILSLTKSNISLNKKI